MDLVWSCWTDPAHIKQWNSPSADWHTPYAVNDVRTGGKFLFVMEAKDGSGGFDFEGSYDEVSFHERISYTTTDGRKATNLFTATPAGTRITETFEPNQHDPAAMQRDFVAGVLTTFKNYVESLV
jgi:Uncharacterized conserved protein